MVKRINGAWLIITDEVLDRLEAVLNEVKGGADISRDEVVKRVYGTPTYRELTDEEKLAIFGDTEGRIIANIYTY